MQGAGARVCAHVCPGRDSQSLLTNPNKQTGHKCEGYTLIEEREHASTGKHRRPSPSQADHAGRSASEPQRKLVTRQSDDNNGAGSSAMTSRSTQSFSAVATLIRTSDLDLGLDWDWLRTGPEHTSLSHTTLYNPGLTVSV